MYCVRSLPEGGDCVSVLWHVSLNRHISVTHEKSPKFMRKKIEKPCCEQLSEKAAVVFHLGMELQRLMPIPDKVKWKTIHTKTHTLNNDCQGCCFNVCMGSLICVRLYCFAEMFCYEECSKCICVLERE